MKRVVAILIACLTLLSTNVLALDDVKISTKVSADLNDEIIIAPQGIAENVNWIIISVADDNGNTVYKGQMRPQEKEFNIYMDSESKRTRNFEVNVSVFCPDGSKDTLTKSFEYYDFKELQTAMELAMNKTYSLKELSKILSLDVTNAYSMINANDMIVDEMSQMTIETEVGEDISGVNITVGNTTYIGENVEIGTLHRKLESFKEVFNKAIVNIILKSKNSAWIEKMIEEVPDALGIIDNEGKFISEMIWYSENKGNVSNNLAKYEYATVEDFLRNFKFYCFLETVNKTHSSSLAEFLRTQNGKYINLDFSEFDSKVSNSDKVDYFVEFFIGADRDTPEKFVSSFNNAVTEAGKYKAPSNDINKKPSQSSSGSSGVSIKTRIENTPVDDTLSENKVFNDLVGYDWAEKEILDLYNKGILKGRSEGFFDPGSSITREEFVAVIVRAFNLTGSKNMGYSDVIANSWYEDAVNIAAVNGLVGGYDGKFGVGKNITREDMAVILFRLAKNKQIDISEKSDREILDLETISDYAREAAESLYKAEIINGMGNGVFAGKTNASRAQVAKLVYALLNR